MYLSKLQNLFVQITKYICRKYIMYLFKFQFLFVEIANYKKSGLCRAPSLSACSLSFSLLALPHPSSSGTIQRQGVSSYYMLMRTFLLRYFSFISFVKYRIHFLLESFIIISPIRHRRLTKKPSLILDHWGKKVPTKCCQHFQNIIFIFCNFHYWSFVVVEVAYNFHTLHLWHIFTGSPPRRPGSCGGRGDCCLWRNCTQVVFMQKNTALIFYASFCFYLYRVFFLLVPPQKVLSVEDGKIPTKKVKVNLFKSKF